MCTTAENENEDDTDENTIINDDQPNVISHNEATSHLELLMVYFEHQVETTPTNYLFSNGCETVRPAKGILQWHSRRLQTLKVNIFIVYNCSTFHITVIFCKYILFYFIFSYSLDNSDFR